MAETRYWEVRGLPYQTLVELKASDLIEHFQRDARTGNVRFWPPSKGVYNYLREKLPDTPILDDSSEEPAFKRPTPVVHTARKKMGMNIDG